MITSVEILKTVKNTEITPKMERAIRTQYKAFFAKAETHVIDYDLFLNFWEDRTQEYLEESEAGTVKDSSVVQALLRNDIVETVYHSERSEESNPQMQVVGFISYGDLNIRVLKKADFFNDDILAELGA